MHLGITATLKGPDGRVPYLSIECLPIRLITLRLIMESNKDYQRDNIILEMVIWLFVIAVIIMDIKATF